MQRILAVVVLILVPAVAAAQRSGVEVGTNLGLSVIGADGATATRIGVPGGGMLGQPSIYASFFPGSHMMVQPQVAFHRLSGGGESLTSVGLGGDVGYLLSGARRSSPYLSATGAYQSVGGGGSTESDFAAGARIGYRMMMGSNIGMRLETGYRRWFDSDLNELTFGLAVGGILGR